MSISRLFAGALSVGTITVIAGCGGSAGATPTPTPSNGGFSIPGLPGLGTGTTGSAPAANTLLSVADVQNISGDSNVAAVGGTCSTTLCVYADTTSSSGGGGVIYVQPFPGAGVIGQGILQAAIASALSGQATSSGGTAQTVSGLGSGAIKEVDANSVTYAFVKGNYLVVLNVSSGTKSGAAMDSQVGAAAQTVAGSV
jgi:hypothetical protein